MATSPKERMEEDKALRDAAKSLFEADVDFIKRDVEDGSLGKRIALRARDGALEMADEAAEYTERNPVTVAAGAAAAVLLVFHRPILSLGRRLIGGTSENEGPDEDADSEPRASATACEENRENSGDHP
jgi:hypothetical protein